MINYDIIAESIRHYEEFGFIRVESPWTVTRSISNITKPEGAKDFYIAEKDKVLVASGEQSFLALYNKEFLPKGWYQTVTPCFRDESFTPLHTKYFIKNELIITGENELNTEYMSIVWLENIVEKASWFFQKYLDSKHIKIKSTSSLSYDIMCEEIELGSYGIRQCDFLKWIYGTGVAEPRLSRAIQKYGIPQKEDN